MNRVKKGAFLVRKWSYTTFNIVNIRKMWEKKGKIRKWSSEIFTLKMEIFPEKNVIQKSWAAKIFLGLPKYGARSPPMIFRLHRSVGARLHQNIMVRGSEEDI